MVFFVHLHVLLHVHVLFYCSTVEMLSLYIVLLKIDSGVLQYAMSTHVISLSNIVVNDGKWHYVQVKWTFSELVIDVDYGLAQVGLIT